MSEEAEKTTEQVEQVAAPDTAPGEPTEPVEQTEQDEWFEEAVAQGKAIVAADTSNKLKLGELADGVEARYGEATLERFAERIDVSYETLKRLRTVYRAYKDQDIGATSPSFGVLSELAAVENRADLIRANPTMTVAEARDLARAARADAEAKAHAEAEAIARILDEKRAAASAANPSDTVTGNVTTNPDTTESADAAGPAAGPGAGAGAGAGAVARTDSGTRDVDDAEWQADQTRRWAGVARTDGVRAYRLYGEAAQQHLDPARLMTVDELFPVIDALTDGGAAMTSLAEKMSALWVEWIESPTTETEL